jgi:uncharacterized protein (TIGR02996 family)
MHDEDGFLSAIRQTPADDVARLVFADWLDEQDDPTCKLKAEFIRLELRMAESPGKGVSRIRCLHRLQQIAVLLEPHWLAVVIHAKIEGCRAVYLIGSDKTLVLPCFQAVSSVLSEPVTECPKQWEKLTPTSDAKVRRCEACKQNVHYCDTLDEARSRAANGTRVALTLAVERTLDDLLPPPREFRRMFGRIKPKPRNTGRTQNRNIQRKNWEEME